MQTITNANIIDQSTTCASDCTSHGENFSNFQAGKLSDWSDKKLEVEGVGAFQGKQFIKDIIKSTGCQISVNAMPAGTSIPFHHTHTENEEIYIFLGGIGEMQIDGTTFPVEEGSIVRIAPKGLRCWRNTGTAPLTSIIIQVKEGSLHRHSLEDGVPSEEPVTWAT